jgi:oligosaccharide repeat unit polymerase
MPSITLDPAVSFSAPRAAAPGRTSFQKTGLIIHAAVILLLAGCRLLYPAFQIDAEQMLYPMCVATTATFLWMLWSWRLVRGTLFDPYPLFVLTAGLFNGGQALLEVFGGNANGILGGRVAPEILVSALYQVTLSMALLHGGALVALVRKPRRPEDLQTGPARRRATRLAGWAMLAIALVPTITLFQSSLTLVMEHGYMSLFRNLNSMSTAMALSAFFVPGIIFLLAGSKDSRGTQIFCLALTAAYAATYLFLGARMSAAMVCIAVAWVFERSIRRIPRLLIVALALVALVVFPLVRETRSVGGQYRSLGDQWETLMNLESPVSTAISEMGHSLVTVTHTMSLAPEVRPYDYGVSYLFALTAVVPNLGWAVHPCVAHGLLSDWLIRTVDRVTAADGGGLGFSFIAEAYLNFGPVGGPLFLGLAGFALCWLFLKADGNDPAKHAFAASFLSFLFVFARGESAIVFRGLVWYAVVPYVLAGLMTLRSGPKSEGL